MVGVVIGKLERHGKTVRGYIKTLIKYISRVFGNDSSFKRIQKIKNWKKIS